MKRNILVVAFLAIAAVTVGCKSEGKSEEVQQEVETQSVEESQAFQQEHSSRSALDWDGTYAGIMPCASCPGIEVTVQLNKDGSFSRTMIYQEEVDGTFIDEGTFTWNEKGSVISITSDQEVTSYKVREGSLVMLDQNGEEIQGELAEHYVLIKK